MKKMYKPKVVLLVGILATACSQGVLGKLGSPPAQRKLQRVRVSGNGGSPAPEDLPLSLCWGDCDNDDECTGSLICFQRDAYEEVPGCENGENDASITDYCIVDPDGPAPTGTPSMGPTQTASSAPSATPTQGPTVSAAPTRTPTISPEPSSTPSDSPSKAPSAAPTHASFGRIEYVGNEGTFYSSYPMPMCKGDCDTDADCEDGLYCHQRNSFEAVPYCDGGEREPSTADFCSWDGTGDVPVVYSDPPEGYFRLKLYWEEGYKWQNETFERQWCMMYNYDGYPGTGLCWIGDKNENCDQDQIYVGKCVDDPRMWFTFVNVTSTTTPNAVHEYLIMTGDNQRCFHRYNREIWLEPCDSTETGQRWFALNGDFYGVGDENKFEISQVGFSTQCVTNDHHPKSGEVVELHDCNASREEDSQTSYWERF